LLIAVYFLPSFLVVATGKGQLQNRHSKARQPVSTTPVANLQIGSILCIVAFEENTARFF
jgi:hypothetical protein